MLTPSVKHQLDLLVSSAPLQSIMTKVSARFTSLGGSEHSYFTHAVLSDFLYSVLENLWSSQTICWSSKEQFELPRLKKENESLSQRLLECKRQLALIEQLQKRNILQAADGMRILNLEHFEELALISNKLDMKGGVGVNNAMQSLAEIEMKLEIETLKSDMDRINSEKRALQEELDDMKENFTALSLEMSEKEDKMRSLEENVKQSAAVLNQNRLLESQINFLMTENSRKDAAISAMTESRIEKEASEIARLEIANTKLNADLAAARDMIGPLEAEIAKLQAALNENGSSASAEFQETVRNLEAAQAALETETTSHNKTKRILEKAQLSIAEFKEKVEYLQNQLKLGGMSEIEVDAMMKSSGLTAALKHSESVFQRLYEDALRRLDSLRVIREQIREKKATELLAMMNAMCNPIPETSDNPIRLARSMTRSKTSINFDDGPKIQLTPITGESINFISPPPPSFHMNSRSQPAIPKRGAGPNTMDSSFELSITQIAPVKYERSGSSRIG
jgi:hypothetical protein